MIKYVSWDQGSARRLDFLPGPNFIVAEQSPDSSSRRTRNSTGKTTLIAIINFCLGANVEQTSCFAKEELSNWCFEIGVETQRGKCVAKRNTSSHRYVSVYYEGKEESIIAKCGASDWATLDVGAWMQVLNDLVFGQRGEEEGGDNPVSFRSLWKHFSRKSAGDFENPFAIPAIARKENTQIENAFLLGLDWQIARDWQKMEDRLRTMSKTQAAWIGALEESAGGSEGQLQNDVVSQSARKQVLLRQIESFKVLEEYEAVEKKASSFTREIHKLSERRQVVRDLVEYYRQGFTSSTSSLLRIEDIVRRLNLVFVDGAKESVESVIEFHESVIQNRNEYLRRELQALEDEFAELNSRIDRMSEEKAEASMLLKTHGALEELLALQQAYSDTSSEVARLEQSLNSLRAYSRYKEEATGKRAAYKVQIQDDLAVQQHDLNDLILTFQELSHELYEHPGQLMITPDSTGIKFAARMWREGGQAVEEMKVFCYDIALVKYRSTKNLDPKVLIHDTPILDGVDRRQVATALRIAIRESMTSGFTYILPLNSDMIPKEIDDVTREILEARKILTISDESEASLLLGIEF